MAPPRHRSTTTTLLSLASSALLLIGGQTGVYASLSVPSLTSSTFKPSHGVWRASSLTQATAPSSLASLKALAHYRGGGQKAPAPVVATPTAAGGDRPAVQQAAAKKGLLTRQEAPKFFALSMMMFCIIYIFTMTRDTKDTLIVSYCGAEAIAFLKVYGVVPAAALFMIGYSHAANRLSKRALFYVTMIPFLAFYALFAYVLYPLRHQLHLENFAPEEGCRISYVYNLVRYWIFSIYYITSELWGSAGVPLLFWQCANDVTPIHQAKRFYPLFAVLGNMAPIASGQTMAFVSHHIKLKYDDHHKAFEETLKVLTGAMMVAGSIVLTLYTYVMTVSNQGHLPARAEGANKGKGKKPKMSLAESAKFLSDSPWLKYIAVMVVSYGLTMEFTEIIWKATVKLAFPDKQDYMEFMGYYSTAVGTMTVLMLLLGSNIIKILGWKVGALATPVLMAGLSAPFFAYISFASGKSSTKKALTIALVIGTIQNILSKATKYAFFDPTKEMCYIPLDQESKVKGKAAIDVLGARLGKSGGAFAQQALVMVFGNIMKGAPFLAVLFYMVIGGWVNAINRLAHMFHDLQDHEHDHPPPPPPQPDPKQAHNLAAKPKSR